MFDRALEVALSTEAAEKDLCCLTSAAPDTTITAHKDEVLPANNTCVLCEPTEMWETTTATIRVKVPTHWEGCRLQVWG